MKDRSALFCILPALVFLLIHALSAFAEVDPENVVRQYLSARTARGATSLLAPQYRLWTETRVGPGMNKKDVASKLEWDFALRPRRYIRDVQVNGNQVQVRFHEDNDFSLLLGFPGWDATATYVVDESGRIVSQLYVPKKQQTDWRPYLDQALPWIEQNRPDALPRIFPEGKLNQTADAAKEWVEVLRAWRESTGQPDPTVR